MKLFIATAFVLFALHANSQLTNESADLISDHATFNQIIKSRSMIDDPTKKDIQIGRPQKWRINKNKIWTGGLVMLSGMAKGFNETLEFNWHGFAAVFPRANAQWFWPQKSYLNKYKDNDPSKGAKFPLSTSVLVFLTDQYHLNNFIHRSTLTAALVIKIGEGKKPLRQYVFDALYYTAAYQLGFGSVYYYFKSRVPK
jgi:hypothetical protein